MHYTLQSNKFFVPRVAGPSIKLGVMTELIRAAAFTVLLPSPAAREREAEERDVEGRVEGVGIGSGN